MRTSKDWIVYFKQNLQHKRIDWFVKPQLTDAERKTILPSVQAWQLGETSDGAHLLAAAKRYAIVNGDDFYCEAVQLFIKEEQKHGNNLGLYLDAIEENSITRDWGDTVFRRIRYYNTSMELWTIAVITVESAAQVFYQSLKDATACSLLKQVCTDILIDEAYHIDFQMQRMAIIFPKKTVTQKIICYQLYRLFYYSTILVVWMAHRKVFTAGGNSLARYFFKMNRKFHKNLRAMYHGKTFTGTAVTTPIQQPV